MQGKGLGGAWSDCVGASMGACGLGGIGPQGGTAWGSGIGDVGCLLPNPATRTPTADEK